MSSQQKQYNIINNEEEITDSEREIEDINHFKKQNLPSVNHLSQKSPRNKMTLQKAMKLKRLQKLKHQANKHKDSDTESDSDSDTTINQISNNTKRQNTENKINSKHNNENLEERLIMLEETVVDLQKNLVAEQELNQKYKIMTQKLIEEINSRTSWFFGKTIKNQNGYVEAYSSLPNEDPSNDVYVFHISCDQWLLLSEPRVSCKDKNGHEFAWCRYWSINKKYGGINKYWIKVHDKENNVALINNFTFNPPI
jgi:hypothetical protein